MSFIRIEGISIPKFKEKPAIELSKQLSHSMYNDVMENFAQQGPGWAPLKPATKKQRLRQGFGEAPILDRKRGNLGLRLGVIESATNDNAIVGVREGVPYARIHQLGGTITRHPFSSWVHLRTNKAGKLLKQTSYPNLARFSRKKHKQKVTRKFTSKGYSIVIPARPYMRFTEELKEKLKRVVFSFFK